MKKVFFLLPLCCLFLVMTAQSLPSGFPTAAARVASLDNRIAQRLGLPTAPVRYLRENVDAAVTGRVDLTEVEYGDKTGQFINVSPKQSVPCEKFKAADNMTGTAQEKTVAATENESAADQTARRAACSRAVSKARSNRRASATVKLVSN